MGILDALVLGILQGVTEFIPVSSSGHLVLGEHYLGLDVEILKSFDVVVHLGTLLAILIYFWKDIFEMLKAVGGLVMGRLRRDDPYLKLIVFIIIGTIPAIFVGLFAEEWIDSTFRSVKMVGMWMLIVGIVYLLGELFYKKMHAEAPLKQRLIEKVDKIRNIFQHGAHESEEIHGMKWCKAIAIGCAQAIALIPGVSRSGATIVAGLFQGIERSAAARFSFLLGIPAIAGAGLLTSLKIPENGGWGVSSLPLVIGFFVSFVFGILSISFLMRFLKRNTLLVFSVYLIVLGFSVFV